MIGVVSCTPAGARTLDTLIKSYAKHKHADRKRASGTKSRWKELALDTCEPEAEQLMRPSPDAIILIETRANG